MLNTRKAGIVGCGFVGAACAYTLMQNGLFDELVLTDIDRARAEGEAMDISHGLLFARPMNIYAGRLRRPYGRRHRHHHGGRKPESGRNALGPRQEKRAHSALRARRTQKTQLRRGCCSSSPTPWTSSRGCAQQYSGLPENRVFGSGTVLDTARLRYLLGEHLSVDSRSVHAFIIGEHGDSEIAVWSSANVSGVPMHEFCEMRGFYDHENAMREIGENVKNCAYEIIERKGATYYGIAMAVRRICEAVVRDEKSILPVSCALHGEFGIDGATLSIPCIVGKEGAEKIIPISLSDEEHTKLHYSAEMLKGIFAEL